MGHIKKKTPKLALKHRKQQPHGTHRANVAKEHVPGHDVV